MGFCSSDKSLPNRGKGFPGGRTQRERERGWCGVGGFGGHRGQLWGRGPAGQAGHGSVCRVDPVSVRVSLCAQTSVYGIRTLKPNQQFCHPQTWNLRTKQIKTCRPRPPLSLGAGGRRVTWTSGPRRGSSRLSALFSARAWWSFSHTPLLEASETSSRWNPSPGGLRQEGLGHTAGPCLKKPKPKPNQHEEALITGRGRAGGGHRARGAGGARS